MSVAAACGSDKPTGLDMRAVAGSYEAKVLTATQAGTAHDYIAAGATIYLALDENGTTSGHFFIPASDLSHGEAVDADMAASWALDGTTVHISQSADTFIRDLPLAVERNSLTGDATFDDVQVHLVMSRQ